MIINTTKTFMGRKKLAMNYKRSEETERILEEVLKCIDDNGGIAKKEQLAQLGVDYRRILDFVENKDIIRIKNGYYTYNVERKKLWYRNYSRMQCCVWTVLCMHMDIFHANHLVFI